MSRISPFQILCGVGVCAIFSSTAAKSPVLPLFADSLGASKADIGFIAAASTVVGILVSLPAGVLSDLWGRRRVILLSMGVFASAPFLYLLVGEVWGLVGVRLYHGLATAIFGPVALALVADLFVKERGEKMGWYSSSTLVGRSLAPLAGGVLISAGAAGYQKVYLACGVGGVLALLLALRLPVQQGRDTGLPHPAAGQKWQETRQGLREVLTHRGILFTSVTEAVQYLAYGALETFLPLYALQAGFSAYQIGLLLGLQVVAVTLTKPLMGRFSDRHGRRWPIAAGLLLGAGSLALVPFCGSFWSLLLVSLVFGLSLATVTASTAALVSELAKAGSCGAALGTMSTIMDVGQASGPVIAGLLIGTWGYGVGFPAIGLALGLACLVFLVVVRLPASPR